MTNQRDNSVSGEIETPLSFSKEELMAEISAAVSKQVNMAMTSREKEFIKSYGLAKPGKDADPMMDGEQTRGKTKDPHLAAALKELDAIKAELASEKAAKQDAFLKQTLAEHLDKAGVLPSLKSAKMAQLIHEKLVSFSEEEGSQDLVFKTKLGEVALEQGLREHFKTDEGKAFLAPRDLKGSGDKAYGKISPGKTDYGSLVDTFINSLPK